MSEAPDYLQCFEKYMCHGDGIHEAWSFEAFVVREADEIAQWHHDMEDALYSRAMTPKGVCSAIQNQLEPFLNDEESAELEKIKKSFEYVAAQSVLTKGSCNSVPYSCRCSCDSSCFGFSSELTIFMGTLCTR